MLSKLLLAGEQPDIVDGNLIEFNCEDCKRQMRRSGRSVARILHRYNLAGELVETVVVDIT